MTDRLRFTGPRTRRVVTQHEELRPAHNNGSPLLKFGQGDYEREIDFDINPYEGGSAGYMPMAALLLAIVVCVAAWAMWSAPDSASATPTTKARSTPYPGTVKYQLVDQPDGSRDWERGEAHP